MDERMAQILYQRILGVTSRFENVVEMREEGLRRFRSVTDRNERDGLYAAVVMCVHCDPNHEVVKSAWIFEAKSEAQECAEEMLRGIIEEAIEETK